MNTIGTILKELRKSKKLKQSDIADFLNITSRHYQDIEYNKIDLPLSKAVALANYFDVSIDYLVGRTDKPEVNR